MALDSQDLLQAVAYRRVRGNFAKTVQDGSESLHLKQGNVSFCGTEDAKATGIDLILKLIVRQNAEVLKH